MLYNDGRENVGHLFFNCAFSKAIGKRVLKTLDVSKGPLYWIREVNCF